MSDARHDFQTLARAFNTREPSHEPLSACPRAEQLIEAASGTLERDQRLRIVDHISQCAQCTQAWRLAMEIGARPPSSIEQPRRFLSEAESARTKSISMRPYALAAGVLCVVGIAAYIVIPVKEQPLQYRDVAQTQAPISQVAESLPRDRFLLRWSAGPEGSTYLLRLTTPDLVPLLVKQDLTAPEFVVPSVALENVARGDQVLWQVEMQLPDGERIASQTYVVTLD